VEEGANLEEGLKSVPVEQEAFKGSVTAPFRENSEIHEPCSVAKESVDGSDGDARLTGGEAQVAMALSEVDVVSGDPGHGLQIFQV